MSKQWSTLSSTPTPALSEDELLNERLGSASEAPAKNKAVRGDAVGDSESDRPTTTFDFVQWGAEPNEVFRPSGRRTESLPSGVYSIDLDQRGLFFQRRNVITDNLIELDDSASSRVIAGINKFWKSKDEYTKRGIIYKRGIMLWGPAGSGKTATLMLLTQQLLEMNGIVVLCERPEWTNNALQDLRRIEPDRPLILILEDVEELIARWGEHEILALLDGENQVSNVVNIATTNYPEQLGARIVNRPSRFDERIFVDMPSETARRRYIMHATRNENMTEDTTTQWVKDTEGFSIAHMRELVVAVFCLGQEYKDVVKRLKTMMSVRPKSGAEFGGGRTGFMKEEE
jgi:hypothetical protein